MKGLIASSNPLFVEVISEALTGYFDDGYVLVNPEYAAERLATAQADVILIDESMPAAWFVQTMQAARRLQNAQILLINPGSNDCVVVNAYRANITNLEDFMRVMNAATAPGVKGIGDTSLARLQEDAQARSGMFNFLASLLNQRPDLQFVRNLRVLGVKAFLEVLNEESTPELQQGITEMVDFIQSTAGQPETQVEQDLAVDWTRLFRGVQAGYGPPPPYEIEYLNGAQDPSQALQLLAREYTAAGARIGERTAERQDYLGLELAFASYLAAREAEAWGSGDATLAEDLAHAGQDFLCRHPGRWVGRFCTKALPEARTGFFHGYLLVLNSLLVEQRL